MSLRLSVGLVLLALFFSVGPARAEGRSHQRPAATSAVTSNTDIHRQPMTAVQHSPEYLRTMRRAGAVDRVTSSLGLGNLVGLGLPIFILVGGAMRLLDVPPPAFLANTIDPNSPLYSWPFLLLAALTLVLFFISGNEKVSKGPKLLAQMAGIPPAVLLAVAIPVVAELSRPDMTTAMLAQVDGVPAGAVGAASLTAGSIAAAVGLGLVALFSASLILLTRLFVSFVVWLSPFPFIDALANVIFHMYAGGLVLLTFIAPPAALFVMVLQTIVALLLLRRLFRFGRTSARIGRGAVRWHLFRRGLTEATDLNPRAMTELDRHAAAATPRLMGWIMDAHGHTPHSPAAVGLSEMTLHLLSYRWRGVVHHAIPAMQLHDVMIRYGSLYDTITFVERQGQGDKRREIPLHLGCAKSQRRALMAMSAELKARGYDVEEASERGPGRPSAMRRFVATTAKAGGVEG